MKWRIIVLWDFYIVFVITKFSKTNQWERAMNTWLYAVNWLAIGHMTAWAHGHIESIAIRPRACCCGDNVKIETYFSYFEPVYCSAVMSYRLNTQHWWHLGYIHCHHKPQRCRFFKKETMHERWIDWIFEYSSHVLCTC